MDTIEQQTELEHHIILYSDGSAYNPGFYGAGAHGYIYSNQDIEKRLGAADRPKKNFVTEQGYVEASEFTKQTARKVVPEVYIDSAYSYHYTGTNNIGEIMGFVEPTTDLLAINNDQSDKAGFNFKTMILFTDSMYLIHILNNIMEDKEKKWLRTVEVNLEYWKKCDDVLSMLLERNIKFEVRKVLGHSTSVGNNLSDRLAYLGRKESASRSNERRFVLTYDKPYWELKDVKHPLLNFKQLFFTNNLRNSTKDVIYSIMEYKDDEPGKKTHDAIYGTIQLKLPPDIIEDAISEYQKSLWSRSIVSTVDLERLYSRDNYHYYNIFGKSIYNFYRKTLTLQDLEEKPVIYSIYPAGLATQALDKMTIHQIIIMEYKDRIKDNTYIPTVEFINITDKVYDSSGKKVVTLLNNGDRVLDVPIIWKDKEVIIPLDLGKDTLTRNQFKKLENDNTKVYLVISTISDKCIEYYTLISTNDDENIAVYCNFYSGKKYVK